jgi:hypothetical protein
MKSSLLVSSIFLFGITTFGQNVLTVITQYSKTGNGGIGKESYSFNISEGTITITDLDNNSSENYDPLKFEKSGFDEKGWYYETYNSDILKDPARWATQRKKPRVYNFYFDKKNGNPLLIIEAKMDESNNPKRKIFYTEKGYLLVNEEAKDKSQTKNTSTNSDLSSFNLATVLLNANSLSHITTKVITAFKTDGEKNYNNDMSYYSFTYKNASDTRAIISYKTSNDEVIQMLFLLPKEQAVEVGKKSFMNFKQKQGSDANAIWVNNTTNLTYEAGYKGEVGIIVVK